jgi:hypothetical protein
MNMIKRFYLWLTTPAAKSSIPPKSTTQDFFERRLLKAAPGSHKEMDFERDQSGQFKNRKTQHAYLKFRMAPVQDQSNDNFILSMMVAYATDSSIMGYAAGGSLVGGMVGSTLASGHKTSTQHENARPVPSDTPWHVATNDSDTTRSNSRSGGITWTDTDDSCRSTSSSPSPSPEPSPSSSSYAE